VVGPSPGNPHVELNFHWGKGHVGRDRCHEGARGGVNRRGAQYRRGVGRCPLGCTAVEKVGIARFLLTTVKARGGGAAERPGPRAGASRRVSLVAWLSPIPSRAAETIVGGSGSGSPGPQRPAHVRIGRHKAGPGTSRARGGATSDGPRGVLPVRGRGKQLNLLPVDARACCSVA
jgi:hypothetical protein